MCWLSSFTTRVVLLILISNYIFASSNRYAEYLDRTFQIEGFEVFSQQLAENQAAYSVYIISKNYTKGDGPSQFYKRGALVTYSPTSKVAEVRFGYHWVEEKVEDVSLLGKPNLSRYDMDYDREILILDTTAEDSIRLLSLTLKQFREEKIKWDRTKPTFDTPRKISPDIVISFGDSRYAPFLNLESNRFQGELVFNPVDLEKYNARDVRKIKQENVMTAEYVINDLVPKLDNMVAAAIEAQKDSRVEEARLAEDRRIRELRAAEEQKQAEVALAKAREEEALKDVLMERELSQIAAQGEKEKAAAKSEVRRKAKRDLLTYMAKPEVSDLIQLIRSLRPKISRKSSEETQYLRKFEDEINNLATPVALGDKAASKKMNEVIAAMALAHRHHKPSDDLQTMVNQLEKAEKEFSGGLNGITYDEALIILSQD